MRCPTTFDELIKVCDATHGKDGVAAFTADKLHHWNWIPYLMGEGGGVFKAPPENLTPTLRHAAGRASRREWYANLLMKYGPDGHALLLRRPGDALADVGPRQHAHPVDHLDGAAGQARREHGAEDGALRADAERAQRATSPARNSHGLGIPAGSKKKEAAWEFIKWALSKETLAMVVKEHGYPSVCRALGDQAARSSRNVLTLNGQDVAALYLEVLQLGGKSGYMKYRTVPVFPQVGDKINKAIERIATKQQAAPEALKQAQAEAIQDLQKAGIKVDT